MKTPKTLKNAIDNDYVIYKIDYANSKQCRVDLKQRFYDQSKKTILSFWINSKYVSRNYPTIYQSKGIFR